MSSITYTKSQNGWIMIIIMPLVCLYMALAYHLGWGNKPLSFNAMIILIAVFTLVMLMFYKLTIYIKGRTIHVKYGIGLIHFKIPVDQLHEATIVRTPWWYGLGIRFTPQGMLYNVHGLDAVKIKYTGNGKTKTVLLGTAEPQELLKQINLLK